MSESNKVSKAERDAAQAAWRGIPARDRVEAHRRAKQGLPHPNPDIAAVASAWARANAYKTRERMPPFVLPLVGIAEGIGAYFVAPDSVVRLVGITASLVVVLCGLQGWNYRKLVKPVLAVPASEASTPSLVGD